MTIKFLITDLNPGDSYKKTSVIYLNSDSFESDSVELLSSLIWHHSKSVIITSEVIL